MQELGFFLARLNKGFYTNLIEESFPFLCS